MLRKKPDYAMVEAEGNGEGRVLGRRSIGEIFLREFVRLRGAGEVSI
jgi:hypothetical protein